MNNHFLDIHTKTLKNKEKNWYHSSSYFWYAAPINEMSYVSSTHNWHSILVESIHLICTSVFIVERAPLSSPIHIVMWCNNKTFTYIKIIDIARANGIEIIWCIHICTYLPNNNIYIWSVSRYTHYIQLCNEYIESIL